MQFFQMMGFGEDYLLNFSRRYPSEMPVNFNKRVSDLLSDRYGATHILKPVYDRDQTSFFTVFDDPELQYSWARDKKISMKSLNLIDILLSQIEEHKTEVLYTNSPVQFPSSFVRRLPGCVKKAIAWRAAPVGNADLSAYDAILSNFNTLNSVWRSKSWRAFYFSPSWDPEMESYAKNMHRDKDIFFAGSYSRTTGHDDRLTLLNEIAELGGEREISLHLLYRRWGRLADTSPGRWIPIPIILPSRLRATVSSPVYGRELYRAISNAKIVINPATNIAGDERGNMRCFEALGCGACMLGSSGRYPESFEAGVHYESIDPSKDLTTQVKKLLSDDIRLRKIAEAGSSMVKSSWSKERQWSDFINVLSLI
jgi:hypothetical protein